MNKHSIPVLPHLSLRPARLDELHDVVAIYEAAKQTPFSVWDENYPTFQDAFHDWETGNLYVLAHDEGAICGVLSVVPENELDELDIWQVKSPGVRELARISIAPPYNGHGYAALMVAAMCDRLSADHCPAVHISAAVSNAPARATYRKIGFQERGETRLYGGSYVLLEKIL